MKLRRRTIGIALAVLVVLLIFVGGLGTHLIVTTGLLRKWVNTDPEKLFLDYDSASAWVPGIIRIRGLAVRGSDDNVQWRFRMEAATISISLPDLLRRQVHATRVRAEGLVFRLREKVRKADFSQAHEKRVPEIPGFSDPPWKTFEPEPPPPSARERSRSEEHTSELQSPCKLVCRLLLEKKKRSSRSPSFADSQKNAKKNNATTQES